MGKRNDSQMKKKKFFMFYKNENNVFIKKGKSKQVTNVVIFLNSAISVGVRSTI